MPLFGNGGHVSFSWASEISCIILHLLRSSGVFPFLVSDSIQRILHSQSFDTVKYLSDPNEGVILYVLPDIRQPWRLVCRNMMRAHKPAELTALFLQKCFVSHSSFPGKMFMLSVISTCFYIRYYTYLKQMRSHSQTTFFNIKTLSTSYHHKEIQEKMAEL